MLLPFCIDCRHCVADSHTFVAPYRDALDLTVNYYRCGYEYRDCVGATLVTQKITCARSRSHEAVRSSAPDDKIRPNDWVFPLCGLTGRFFEPKEG